MKATAQSAGVGTRAKDPRMASQLGRAGCLALLDATQGPCGRRPEKVQSEGNLAPLVFKKFQVNREPERETTAVHGQATWPDYLQKRRREGGQMSEPGGCSLF